MTTVIDGCRWRARVALAPRARRGQPPVVLVHGFGISSSYFVPLAKRLAPHFDVYVPDLPGHGKSATPPRPLDVPALGAALHAWLDANSIARACIIANSMGCQVTAELATRSRDVSTRLVMIGPTLDREARTLWRVLPRFMAGGRHERLSMAALLLRDYARMHVRLIAEFRAMLAYRIEDVVPRISVPVLFIRGEHDAIAPLAWVEELVSATPMADLSVVRDGGHAVHYGRPDQTLNVIMPFLRCDEHGGPRQGETA
jgi:pimeloyl-ACP methyl ester carboxylesterase